MTRSHRLALAALVLVGAVRGLYWTAIGDVWRPDERQHYAYVQDLATGRGLPVVGEVLVSADAAQIGKASPTNGQLSTGVTTDPTDPAWGATGLQYEAGQPPLYYAVLAVPYRLAASAEPLDRLYVLRVASLALALTTVPLTWLLARAAFADRPAVWLLAPALLVTWQGVNAQGGGLSNDALVPPLCLAALTAVAWAWARGPSLPLAAAAGAAFGLGLLTKPSAATIALPLGIGGLAALLRHRPSLARAAAWAGIAIIAAVVPVGPWLAWQRAVYGEESPQDRFNEILAPIIGQHRWSGETLNRYLSDTTSGLFNLGEHRGGFERYTMVLLAVALVAAVAGIAVSAARGRRREVFALAWLTSALPLGFATMAAVVQLALDGYGTVVGRYLAPVLPTVAVVLAAGAALVLGRFAVAAVALVIATTLTLEVDLDHQYLARTYLRGLPEAGTAPAVVQEWADTFVPSATIAMTPPCPATALGLAFRGQTAPGVLVDGREARRIGEENVLGDVAMGYYALPDLARPFEVVVAAPGIAVAAADREPDLSLVGRPGDPVARLYCRSADPRAARFAQTHGPQHPDLALHVAEGWPVGWAAAGWAALTCALAAVALRARAGRSRRR